MDKIKTIGLYRNKAQEPHRARRGSSSTSTAARCRTRARRWRALPGVGRKTANVVLNVAFGQPTIGVDTHLFRVANRTGLAPGKTPLDVELDARSRRARALQAQRAITG